MVLTLNIGNTNITLGGYAPEGLKFCAQLSTDREASADEYAVKLLNLFHLYKISEKEIEGAILGSVVPVVTAPLKAAVELLCGKRALTVGPGLKSGLPIRIDNPGELGAELLCGAVAAMEFQKPPLVVIQMDTALTMMAVDAAGALVGGVILPGPQLALNSLVERTARLPQVDFSAVPAGVLSTNTADCLQSGTLLGCAATLDGLMERFRRRLGPQTAAIATGSVPQSLMEACECGIIYKETLISDGLYAIWRRNHR